MSDKKTKVSEEKLNEKLAQIRHSEEESRAKEFAEKVKLPYINLLSLPIDGEALMLIPKADAEQAKLAVVMNKEGTLTVVVQNPENELAKKLIASLEAKKFKISICIGSYHSLEHAFERYKTMATKGHDITGKIEIKNENLAEMKEKLGTLESIKAEVEKAPQDNPVRILELIFAGATEHNCSDVHLEATPEGALFRYRIDGILHDVVFLSQKAYSVVISRIKLLSSMVLNIHDKAQDGRFTIVISGTEIEVRVSIIPGPAGENVVMRLLNPKGINVSIKDLGFRDDLYEFVKKELDRPNGMFVTTGPTGSGKTTALYAFLREVTNPELKIITLEDPIEYHLKGITQTQVETERGYTFAAGLRAILRQDPDIVLVGEIRDKETAEIAIQAALTGHIVFSTLHTNDAAGAIPRFIDMGANPTTLSSALIDMMAQRLLRRVCPECKEEYEPTAEEKEKIKKALERLPKEIKVPDFSGSYKLVKGKGCPKCNNSGYKGRVGVYEIINVGPEIEKLITKNPSHAEVLELAKKTGFVTMYQDGMIKVLEKVTTIEELESIVGVEN